MTSEKQIKLGAILSYISIFLNIAAGLIYTPWMVSQIGQSQYGLYTLANSLITLFLVDFGLSSATSRYISKYRAEGKQEKINDFLGAIYKLYLFITLVIFLILAVLYFFIDSIYTQLTPEELKQFKVVYIISASFAVFNFPFVTLNGILKSYEKFIQLKLADILYRISFVVSTVIALSLGQGLYALVSLHAIVGIFVVLYKIIVTKKSVPIKVNYKYSDGTMYKEIFSFSIWVTLATLAQRLIFNITPSILGIVANSSQIAIFGLVTTIESYVYTITTAINGMFISKVSQLLVSDEKKLTPLMLKVGKFLYAINGLIVAGFAVVGQSFIMLWMGADYIDAYWGILLVIIPGLFYNSLQIANTTMIATKKVNIQAYVTIIIGVVNLLLSFPLSKEYGAIGSCISIFIAYIIRAVVLNIIYHRILPFNMIQFVKKCYLQMSVPIITAIAFGIGLNWLIDENSWMMFLIKGSTVVIIYLVSLFLLGLNTEERYNCIKIIKNKIKK